MLSIVTGIIFFGMMLSVILVSIKSYKLKSQLRKRRVYISSWRSKAAIKDLKEIINTSNDSGVKKIAAKIIDLNQMALLICLVSLGFIFFIFFINGIFKLGL